MDDKQKEAIRKQARGILDKFAKTLEGLPSPKKIDVSKGESTREEIEGSRRDDDFRSRVFANAPNKNDNSIIAEKGSWA